VTTIKERYEAIPCEICGEDADHKITFLLEGTRRNPASRAYGKDDCSWCSDKETHACDEHRGVIESSPPEGYVYCSTFYGHRFPHMIHKWVTVEKTTEAVEE
jgi:hypothetical protein